MLLPGTQKTFHTVCLFLLVKLTRLKIKSDCLSLIIEVLYPQILLLLFSEMYTALMAACGAPGYKEDDVLNVVTLLLGKGADVNAHDRYR